jgi:hypothetical protein
MLKCRRERRKMGNVSRGRFILPDCAEMRFAVKDDGLMAITNCY